MNNTIFSSKLPQSLCMPHSTQQYHKIDSGSSDVIWIQKWVWQQQNRFDVSDIYILHYKDILLVLHSIIYLTIMPKYEQKQMMGQMLQNYLYLHRGCQQLIIKFFFIVLCQIVMSTELYCIFIIFVFRTNGNIHV